MRKSVIFLINGLGIEKPGSYSISIDQAMPNLAKTKETSYFTTAITSSLEYRGAYQKFFLGDTYKSELKYIKDYVLNENIGKNPSYKSFVQAATRPNSKLHIFVEPTNDKVVEQINNLVNGMPLEKDKQVYVHLLLPQLTTKEYNKLISIVNYIKFHLNEHITAGFVLGKESISEQLTKEQLDYTKKLFFMCSAERWSETDKKLKLLQESNIRPCDAKGFCTTNNCKIENGDTILFFNTRRDNYDNLIVSLLEGSKTMFKEESTLRVFSLIKLYSNYNITSFIDNVEYENSLANVLLRNGKKALIITDNQYINLINFYANGLNSINNPIICFMEKTNDFYRKEYIEKLINATPYDLIIFDYYMDTSSTINHMKDELSKIDIIIGNLSEVCANNHSLFITSLFGLKKEMPVADYNPEKVMINYEMQIPIFFFDYTYPRSKYDLFPGDTNDILSSALRCITSDKELDTLIREKTIIGSLLKSIIK